MLMATMHQLDHHKVSRLWLLWSCFSDGLETKYPQYTSAEQHSFCSLIPRFLLMQVLVTYSSEKLSRGLQTRLQLLVNTITTIFIAPRTIYRFANQLHCENGVLWLATSCPMKQEVILPIVPYLNVLTCNNHVLAKCCMWGWCSVQPQRSQLHRQSLSTFIMIS